MDVVDELTTELDSVRQRFQSLLSTGTSTNDWRVRIAEIKSHANATVAALWDAGYCRRAHEIEGAGQPTKALKTVPSSPLMFDIIAGFARIHQNKDGDATTLSFQPGLIQQLPINIESNLLSDIDEIYRRYGSQLVQRLIYACEKIAASVELERSSILQQTSTNATTKTTADPDSEGRKKARWTQQEKDIQKLKEKRMHTKAILDALRTKYPDLTWEKVRSICNRNSTPNRFRRR